MYPIKYILDQIVLVQRESHQPNADSRKMILSNKLVATQRRRNVSLLEREREREILMLKRLEEDNCETLALLGSLVRRVFDGI
jgi:hypothetical protein